jgi:hypothetical protein
MKPSGGALDCGLADTNLKTQSRDDEHQRWRELLLRFRRAGSFVGIGH